MNLNSQLSPSLTLTRPSLPPSPLPPRPFPQIFSLTSSLCSSILNLSLLICSSLALILFDSNFCLKYIYIQMGHYPLQSGFLYIIDIEIVRCQENESSWAHLTYLSPSSYLGLFFCLSIFTFSLSLFPPFFLWISLPLGLFLLSLSSSGVPFFFFGFSLLPFSFLFSSFTNVEEENEPHWDRDRYFPRQGLSFRFLLPRTCRE